MTPRGPMGAQEALLKLLEVSRHLGECADLDTVLQTIIDALRDLLQADRATVFVYDASNETLVTRVAHGIGGASTIRIPLTQGIAGYCAQTKEMINIPDAYADERFDCNVDARTGYRTQSILAVPLLDDGGGLVGVAQVLNKFGGAFDRHDEVLARGLAAHAAVAVRRATLIEDRIMRIRLQEEMGVARSIQQGAFPRCVPKFEHYAIGAHSTPTEACGGDAFDTVPLAGPGLATDCDTAERAMLMVADATGHGVGPALSSMQVRGMLRVALRLGQPLNEVVREVNAQVRQDLPQGRFVTAWFGLLDPATHTIEGFSAGQAPLFIYRYAEDRFDEIGSDAPPLGILAFPASMCATRRFQIRPRDILLVLTDGYYEAFSPSSEEFDRERVFDTVRSFRDASPGDLITALDKAVLAFAQSSSTPDDRTALIVKRLS